MPQDIASDSDFGRGGQHQDLPSAYEVLLTQYRETLARIHVLEMQVQNLENTIKQSAQSPVLTSARDLAPPLDFNVILSRLETLENPEEQAEPRVARVSAEHINEPPANPTKAELSQIRVQNDALESQLAKVTAELDEIRSRSRRRSDSSRRRGASRKQGLFEGLLGKKPS